MKLPEMIDYQQALQNPRYCLADPILKVCQAETDNLGPWARSGGFALTYHLNGQGREWAVRCFHKDVPDLQRRYAAISAFLSQHPEGIFTSVDYQAQGIRISGDSFPIIKMPWIHGQTLCQYVSNQLSQPQTLLHLSEQIRDMAQVLDRLGVAHGDLQEGNIIITSNGAIRLVDYDGFYVPALRGERSQNLGKPNFQHPRRAVTDFGPELDRFSLIVMYLGVAGTAAQPSLWNRYGQGADNTLLREDDFLHPDTSPVLHELEQVAGLSAMVRSFRSICKAAYSQVPRLEEFIRVPAMVVPSASLPTVVPRVQFPILRGDQRDSLLRHIGDVVEVVGGVVDIKEGVTKYGHQYVFLNLGDWRTGCFTIVLWSEALENFRRLGTSPRSFVNKWVRITGLIQIYNGAANRPSRPQIIPSWPGEIEVISSQQASVRLAMAPFFRSFSPVYFSSPVVSPPMMPPSSRNGPKMSLDDELMHLYRDFPSVSPLPLQVQQSQFKRANRGQVSSQQRPSKRHQPAFGYQRLHPNSYRLRRVMHMQLWLSKFDIMLYNLWIRLKSKI